MLFEIRDRKECPLKGLWKFANFSKLTQGDMDISFAIASGNKVSVVLKPV